MNPIILAAAGILLFGLGLGLGFWFARIRGKRDAIKASDIQNEMDDYRRRVSEHFGETAQHFEAIGKQYRSLYKHMAQGAGALCDTAQSDALLEFAGGDAEAITSRATDEPEGPPEVIRDYADAEEIDSAEVEPLVEASDTSASPESSPVSGDIAAEPPAEDVIADQVETPTPVETDRTVH